MGKGFVLKLCSTLLGLLIHFTFFIRPTHIPLQIGSHNYFNSIIKVAPVRTVMDGLCYRFKLPNSLLSSHKPSQLVIGSSTSGVDRLEKLHFYIASDNTWQGVIMNKWPYSKTPMLVSGIFSTESISAAFVELDENIWKYRKGMSDFDECMNDQPLQECISIFDPRPNR